MKSENTNKHIEIIRKKKNQHPGVKKSNKLKISLDWLNNTFELAEKRISKLEDGSIEIPSIKNKFKRMKKINSFKNLWDTIRYYNICIMEVLEGEGK